MTETSKKRKRRGSASSKGEPSTSIGRSKRDERKSSDGDAGESHFAAAADEGKIDFAGPSKRDRGTSEWETPPHEDAVMNGPDDVEDGRFEHGELVERISIILSQKSNTDACTVEYLVDFLNSTVGQENVTEVSMTKEDVATLLLPWSVAKLMNAAGRKSSDKDAESFGVIKLAWSGLADSLDNLAPLGNDTGAPPLVEDLLFTSLSQSTLNKIVPYALSVSFGTEPGIDAKGVSEEASRCYRHLVNRYHPSFDVACSALLAKLDELVAEKTDESRCKSRVLLPHHYSAVESTLQLMNQLMPSANPKKLFGSVVALIPSLGRLMQTVLNGCGLQDDASMIEYKKNIETLIRSILWGGMFHPDHHIDGFRAMEELHSMPSLANLSLMNDVDRIPTKPTKSCFQQGLFKFLSKVYAHESSGDARATTVLLSVVTRGYFEQVKKSSQKSVSVEFVAHLQYRFWSHLMLPALEVMFRLIRSPETQELLLAILRAVDETLSNVLEFDVYLPSYSDPDEAHLKLLTCITDGLIDATSGEGCGDKERAVLSSLNTALQLNHRLVHGRLAGVIYLGCACLSNQPSVANTLLLNIAKTYRELRQTLHFLNACRTTFQSSEGCSSILSCGNVVEMLAMAYQTCPPGQLKEIWEFFDGWVVQVVSKGDQDASLIELSFVVRMFILFAKNIRTSKYNSAELRFLTENSMVMSMSQLIGNARTDDSETSRDRVAFASLGFDLCGWLVDLHARCCFWIDGESAFRTSVMSQGVNGSASLNIVDYLRNVAKSVTSNGFEQWKNRALASYWSKTLEPLQASIPEKLESSILRLSVHRIQQLHSLIYYLSLEDDPSGDELVNEARTLVDFVMYVSFVRFYAARRNGSSDSKASTDMFSALSQSTSVWTKYSDETYAKMFLTWFFVSLSDGCGSEQTKEGTLAMILSMDASFYDNGQLMSVFVETGLQVALSHFVDSVEDLDEASKLRVMLVGGNHKLDQLRQYTATTKANINIVSSRKGYSSAMAILRYLSSAPIEFSLGEEISDNLGVLRVLDLIVSRSVQCAEDRRLHVEMLCASKTLMFALMSKLVPRISSYETTSIAQDLLRNCVDFCSHGELLVSTSKVLSEYLSVCIDYYERDDSLLTSLVNHLEGFLRDDVLDLTARLVVAQSTVRKLNTLRRSSDQGHSKKMPVDSKCAALVLLIYEHLWKHAYGSISGNDSNVCQSILLVSDILAFVASCSSGDEDSTEISPTLKAQLVVDGKGVYKHMLNHFLLVREANFADAHDYLIASLAESPHFLFLIAGSKEAVHHVLNALNRSHTLGRDVPLLDAALASLIRLSDANLLRMILDFVVNDESKLYQRGFVVKVFHLLIACANSQDLHPIIRDKCATLVLTTVGLLRDEGASPSDVLLFSKTVITLISKKELFLLSGRDIAMICCEMNRLFSETENADPLVFKSCCGVMSSLIAHYPKQLYGCPSPLFSFMMAIKCHLLLIGTKQGLTQKCLEYTKLCELLIPHKEVFKKYVVGLILKYISFLNSGMSPITKSKLIPSIYALLDMCTEFETRQINSMIDVPSRALFAPVFQSYKKYYQYHGQA
mmetsp:Transcript_33625/g.80437  ORF Transcript_33625/g.80437 Transcript_33625/m.80437 type:complete len:1579 (-) Transcript_33625:2706-7442(-)